MLNEHDDIHHRCDMGGKLLMIIIILSRGSSLCFCSTFMTKTFSFSFFFQFPAAIPSSGSDGAEEYVAGGHSRTALGPLCGVAPTGRDIAQ